MLDNLNTLEERIEKPGYLLILVVSLLLLIIGFVNVISFDGYGTPILGKFSIVHIGMVLFMLFLLATNVALLFRPSQDGWLRTIVGFVAARPPLVLAMLAGYAVVIWHMFTADTWLFLPVLQLAFLALMVIFAALVLLHDWDGAPGPGLLRRGLVYLFGALIALEILAQLLALAGLLPSLTTDLTEMAPHDRVYFVGPEGVTNTTANSYGFHYPDFRLQDDSYRVVLLGDQAVQALELPKTENMGVLIDEMLRDSDDLGTEAEVLALGFPDYGAYVYLDVPFWVLFEAEFEPDEVIIFVDFNNDFQRINGSDGQTPYFFFENGELTISDDDFWMRHELLHASLWGLEGFQPRRVVKSHYLTYGLLQRYLVPTPVAAANLVTAPQDDIALDNSFAFYEELNDEAMAVLQGQLDLFLDNAAEKGYKVSLVTIPVFPETFYAQADAEAWTTEFGAADLALPERELQAYAAERDISILTMIDYMRANNLDTTAIAELYYDVAEGGLTPAGHALFAAATYECFLAGSSDAAAGCHRAD